MKSFTIGERREQRIEQTPGPGEYDIDGANNLIKSKSPNINMGSLPGRPDMVGQTEIRTSMQGSFQTITQS